MTLDEIQDRLDDQKELNQEERTALWEAIQKLDEPMRASLISTFVQMYPETDEDK